MSCCILWKLLRNIFIFCFSLCNYSCLWAFMLSRACHHLKFVITKTDQGHPLPSSAPPFLSTELRRFQSPKIETLASHLSSVSLMIICPRYFRMFSILSCFSMNHRKSQKCPKCNILANFQFHFFCSHVA